MHFINRSHVIENILRFTLAETGEVPSVAELRNVFFQCLNNRQSIRLSATPNASILFSDSDLARSDVIVGMVKSEGVVTNAEVEEKERSYVTRNIKHALMLIRHLEPRLAGMIDLLVSDFVIIDAIGLSGGTASNALGCIWLSPLRQWTTIDFAEAILHESIHLSLFMGDVVHGLYISAKKVREPEAMCISAIRKVARPVDKALHSACVAASLWYFYAALGNDGLAATFVLPLKACLKNLQEKPSFFLSDYGKAVVRVTSDYVEAGDPLRLPDYIGAQLTTI